MRQFKFAQPNQIGFRMSGVVCARGEIADGVAAELNDEKEEQRNGNDYTTPKYPCLSGL